MGFWGFKIVREDKSDVTKSSVKESTSSVPTGIPYTPSAFITTGQPVWRNFSELIYLLNCYYQNPVVNAVINIKAEAAANAKLFVKDLKNGEMRPLHSYDDDGGVLSRLLSRPNPLQSSKEWSIQNKVNYEVFGNSYCYASVPVGFEKSFGYEDISVINNLHPYLVAPILTGKWLDATELSEIVSGYEFTNLNGGKRMIPAQSVMHLNNINIELDSNFTQGKSKLIALKKPISNIDNAYESRNVLIRKRGALGILTSEKGDAVTGQVPLRDNEIESVQEAFRKYGLMEDQYQQIISPVPLKYQKMAMSVKELMLFEEVESDAVAVCNGLRVPELLVKYYIKNGTFENQDASEKRLYDSTIIPEEEKRVEALNHFLKLRDRDIELVASFDHLNVLQINKKEQAETKKLDQDTALAAFKVGAITYDQYLASFGMPTDPEIGSNRIWDLDDRQLYAIGINKTKEDLDG